MARLGWNRSETEELQKFANKKRLILLGQIRNGIFLWKTNSLPDEKESLGFFLLSGAAKTTIEGDIVRSGLDN